MAVKSVQTIGTLCPYVEDSASLTIISPNINDSADYMCTAGNKLGSVDTEASLTVQSESEKNIITCFNLRVYIRFNECNYFYNLFSSSTNNHLRGWIEVSVGGADHSEGIIHSLGPCQLSSCYPIPSVSWSMNGNYF